MSDDSRELSSIDKLVETEDKTNDDGTVTVTIDEWTETDDGSITVHYITPTGDRETDTMPFPKPGDRLEEYKFYRLVKSAGLSMRNADLLEGESVRARRSARDGWSLSVPEITTTRDRARTIYEREARRVKGVNWTSWIVTVFWILAVTFTIGITVYALL